MEIAKLILEFVKALAWPALVLALAIVFRVQIRRLIERLKRASLPGGFALEIADAQRVPPEEQRRRLEVEATEVASSLSRASTTSSPVQPEDLAATVEIAETLALKEIEAEYGGDLRRQIYLQGNVFDAVIWGRRNVVGVEVKLIGGDVDRANIMSLIGQAEHVATQYNRNVFSLLIVAVTLNQSAEERESLRRTLLTLQRGANVPVDVRIFDLADLKHKYGLVDSAKQASG